MIVVPFLLVLACQAAAVLAAPLFNCVGGTVYVVAHADDDLLFQSPDLYTDVSSGACVTTVIFSAGDSGTTGTTYSNSREVGNQEAYSFMATGKSGGKSVYTEVIGTLGGQPVTVRTLAAAPQVQRVYFRLPDGNMDGSGFPTTGYQSLRMLYFGSISSITNQPQTATFTLATLKQALAEILVARQPSYVRTLDYMSDYDSGDHADHLTVGRITNEVAGQYSNATISGYMGYPVSNFAPTLSTSDAAFKNKANAFFQYTPYDSAECQAYAACVAAGRGESYWLTRQYVVNSYLAQMSYQGVAQTPVTLPKGQDIARQADVTASSEWPTQPAEAAIDGKVQGYPGNSSAEWCSYGETVGAWIRLDWDDPYNVTDIVLNDRPNLNDWMTGGTLTFADNATVSFGALANDGSATLISLGGSRGSVVTDSIFLYVTSVSSSTTQVGLAEIQVFGTRCKGCTIGSNLKNSTTTQTSQGSSSGLSSSIDLALSAKATSSSSAPQQGPEKAIDGYVDGYKEDGTGIYSEEWASYGETTGAWINLTWPAYYMIDSLVFHDRPNKNDWITGGVVKFSDGNSLKVTSLDNKGGATVFNLTSPVNVSSLLFTVTSTGQQTSSAGLAEIEAYYSLPQTPVNISFPSTNKTTTLPVQGDLEDAEDWEDDLALLPGVVATASSSSPGQGPANAINGDPNGYKDDGTGDAYQEWASYYEGVGTWINLTFPNPIQVSQISLFDRPNAADQITGGRFAFSNGERVSVGALYNNGSGTTFSIPDIQTTSIKFTVTSISSTTSSAGLSEFAVFGKVLNSTQYAGSGSNSTATPTSNSTATASATSTAPTSIFTGEQIQRSLDLAVNATASASSYAPGQGPENAIDTYVDGYKESGTGMPYQEWASYGGGVGTTFTLTWSSNVTVDAVVLYDRPNLNDQITSGTLTFDSGNVYQIGSLPNNSTGKAIVINHETTSKIVLTVTGVSSTTSSAGLAEFAVYGSAGGNGTSTITSSASASSATASGSLISGSANSTSSVPTSTSSAASSIFTGEQIQRSLDLAVNATAAASSYAPGQGPEKATDTYVDGYKESGTGMPYQEWASYGGGVGTTFTLTWPSNVTVDAVVLYDRPNLNDQVTSGTLTFDSGNVYQVGSLPNAGTGKAIVINHETTSQIVLTVTGVSSTTSSVGLAEFAVYGSAGGNGTSTITSSASASSATSTASSASLNSTVVSGNASVATSASLNSSASAVPTGSVSLNASSVFSSTGLNSSAALPVPTGFNSSFALPSSTGFNYSSVLPSSTGLNSSAAFPSATASNSSVLPSATPSGFNLSSSSLPSASANGSAVLPSSSLAWNLSVPLPSSTFAPSAASSLNISSIFASSTASASANLTSSASVPVSTASQNSSSAASSSPTLSSSATASSSSTLSSSATASSASPSSVLPSSAISSLSASSSVQLASSRVSSTISSSASMVTSTRASSASSTAHPSSSSVVSSSSKVASSTSAAQTGLPTAPAQAATVNIARLPGVKVTASSSISKSPPSGAIDGKVGGLSVIGFGTASQEWVANGVKGEWIELNWPQQYLMKDIILYGRLNNVAGGIEGGTLNFTDGTIIKVGSLSSSGSHVSLGDGLTVSGVRLTVGAGTLLSSAAGLAEFEIFNKPAPSYGLVGTLGNVVGQTLGDVLGIVGLRE